MKKSIKQCLIVLVVIMLFPIFLEYLVFRNSWYSVLSNSEWSGFLGGYVGGIATLLGVEFTIKESKEQSSRENRKKEANDIIVYLGRYIAKISSFFYDSISIDELNKKKDKSDSCEEKLKYDLEIEKIRKRCNREVANECFFILRMKLKDVDTGKEIQELLKDLHAYGGRISTKEEEKTAAELIEEVDTKCKKLEERALEILEAYIDNNHVKIKMPESINKTKFM